MIRAIFVTYWVILGVALPFTTMAGEVPKDRRGVYATPDCRTPRFELVIREDSVTGKAVGSNIPSTNVIVIGFVGPSKNGWYKLKGEGDASFFMFRDSGTLILKGAREPDFALDEPQADWGEQPFHKCESSIQDRIDTVRNSIEALEKKYIDWSSKEDFSLLSCERRAPACIPAILRSIDQNGDKFLSKEEILDAVTFFGVTQINEFDPYAVDNIRETLDYLPVNAGLIALETIRDFDLDGDRLLSYAEAERATPRALAEMLKSVEDAQEATKEGSAWSIKTLRFAIEEFGR